MTQLHRIAYLALAAAMFWPALGPAAGLAAGVVFALLFGNPFADAAARGSGLLLKVAVVGLGFGLQLDAVIAAGATGLWITGLGVGAILLAGLALGRVFGLAGDTRFLLASGTAICGGSAIAAVAPVIGARREAISVAMACVFLLNALALFVFPAIGRALEMDASSFALWAAIAIHDTSSVVGAGAMYGPEALAEATVIKLARALWIVPLVIGLAAWMHRTAPDADSPSAGVRWPWFIGLFVAAAGLRSLLPALSDAFDLAAAASRQLMTLVLFLIGSGLSVAALRAVGWRPLAHAAVLWLLVSSASLAVIVLAAG